MALDDDGAAWAPVAPHDYRAGQDVRYGMAAALTVLRGWTAGGGPVALHLPMGWRAAS